MAKTKQPKIKLAFTRNEASSIFDVLRKVHLKEHTGYSISFVGKLNDFLRKTR